MNMDTSAKRTESDASSPSSIISSTPSHTLVLGDLHTEDIEPYIRKQNGYQRLVPTSRKRAHHETEGDEGGCDMDDDGNNNNNSGDDQQLTRLRINSRERKRMHDLNSAMDGLREVMPYAQSPNVRKLSKIASLMLARNYIVSLQKQLDEANRLVKLQRQKQHSAVSFIPPPPPAPVVSFEQQQKDTDMTARLQSLLPPAAPSPLALPFPFAPTAFCLKLLCMDATLPCPCPVCCAGHHRITPTMLTTHSK